MRLQVRSLPLLSGLPIRHCRELWCRSQMRLGSCVAVAVALASSLAPIWPLAWEPLYAVGAALERQKDKRQKIIIINKKQLHKIIILEDFLNLFFSFFLSFIFLGPNSRHRGQITATAAGLHHSHSNVGSELHLWPTPQLTATPDP